MEQTTPTHCTALTASGQPCQAWAIRDSDPPRCAPHSGLVGAPPGNSNAVTHGYYRKRVEPEEIDALFDRAAGIDITQEIILLRVLTHRLASYLTDPDLSLKQIKSIAPLIVSTSRALGYLHNQLPDSPAFDFDAALDELSQEWGWDL